MTAPRLGITLRLHVGDTIAIGPGKADLLSAIAASGSISAAARSLGLSYRRAWVMVDSMNSSFERPLVATTKGGDGGGGAHLSTEGKDVLAAYRTMVAAAHDATAPHARLLLERLR
jgi:molybdate transport system regulatory protein